MAKNRSYTSESGKNYEIKGGKHTGYVPSTDGVKSSYAFDNQVDAMKYCDSVEKHGDSFDRNFSNKVKG